MCKLRLLRSATVRGLLWVALLSTSCFGIGSSIRAQTPGGGPGGVEWIWTHVDAWEYRWLSGMTLYGGSQAHVTVSWRAAGSSDPFTVLTDSECWIGETNPSSTWSYSTGSWHSATTVGWGASSFFYVYVDPELLEDEVEIKVRVQIEDVGGETGFLDGYYVFIENGEEPPPEDPPCDCGDVPYYTSPADYNLVAEWISGPLGTWADDPIGACANPMSVDARWCVRLDEGAWTGLKLFAVFAWVEDDYDFEADPDGSELETEVLTSYIHAGQTDGGAVISGEASISNYILSDEGDFLDVSIPAADWPILPGSENPGQWVVRIQLTNLAGTILRWAHFGEGGASGECCCEDLIERLDTIIDQLGELNSVLEYSGTWTMETDSDEDGIPDWKDAEPDRSNLEDHVPENRRIDTDLADGWGGLVSDQGKFESFDFFEGVPEEFEGQPIGLEFMAGVPGILQVPFVFTTDWVNFPTQPVFEVVRDLRDVVKLYITWSFGVGCAWFCIREFTA